MTGSSRLKVMDREITEPGLWKLNVACKTAFSMPQPRLVATCGFVQVDWEVENLSQNYTGLSSNVSCAACAPVKLFLTDINWVIWVAVSLRVLPQLSVKRQETFAQGWRTTRSLADLSADAVPVIQIFAGLAVGCVSNHHTNHWDHKSHRESP